MKKIKKEMKAPEGSQQFVSEFFIKQSFMYHTTSDLAIFRRIIDEIIRERAMAIAAHEKELKDLQQSWGEEKKNEVSESKVSESNVVQIQQG